MIKQINYRPDALVLRGISCTFEEGHKIRIVGRIGSGKTTLIEMNLFCPVELARGTIVMYLLKPVVFHVMFTRLRNF